MRQFICCALLVIASTIAQSADKRPKITGIDHVDFYTTAPKANVTFTWKYSVSPPPPRRFTRSRHRP